MEAIDQIRQAANIVDIASLYTTLRRRGKKHVGLCPFHAEKSPSFTVDEEKQLFHCFGCNAGGDIFTLVMEKENLSFPEALRFLAERYQIKLPERRKLSPQMLKLEEKLYSICEQALAFFRKNLFNTEEGKEALAYLKRRNISEDIIQKLKIGYAFNAWDSLAGYFESLNTAPDLLEKAGLALKRPNKEGYYDRFRARVIFPIFNLAGKVVAFGGRTVVEAEPKYLNSPDTPIYSKGNLLYGLNFCKEAIREKGEALLVEGYTDFLALCQAGIANIVASLGTSLTSQQVSLALRFAPRIVICYDGDDAGKKAAERAVSLCFEQNIQSRVLNLPDKLDPDEFIKRYGPARFQDLVKNSTPGLKFILDHYLPQVNSGIPEEKAKAARNVLAEIEKIPDSLVRSEYLKQASEYLELDEERLRSLIKLIPEEKKPGEGDIFLVAEKRLLKILFDDLCQGQDFSSKLFSKLKESDVQGLKSEPGFSYLTECFRLGKKPVWHELREKFPLPVAGNLSKILMEEERNPTLEEAFDCLYALRQLSLEKMSRLINVKIAKLEKQGEKEKVLTLLKQRHDLAKELTLLAQRNL